MTSRNITQRPECHTCGRAAPLIKQIRDYIDHWNTDSKPFVWAATADKILAKYYSRGFTVSARSFAMSSRPRPACGHAE